MKKSGWTILTYALIIFLGGIFGYVKAGSVPSLVMGVSFAAVLGICAFLISNGKKYGFSIALAATALLSAFFLYRFIISFKVMPSLVMCLISLIVLAVLLTDFKKWK